jgi:anti-anti-sigma regulatory factor
MTVVTPGSPSRPGDPEPGGGQPGPGPRSRWIGPPERSGAGRLAVWTDQRAHRCVLRLEGSLTRHTVSQLDRHVDLLGCRSSEEVTVDLTGLDVLDEVGARLLVGLAHYVAGMGGKFTLKGGTESAGALIAAAERELAS